MWMVLNTPELYVRLHPLNQKKLCVKTRKLFAFNTNNFIFVCSLLCSRLRPFRERLFTRVEGKG